MTLRATIEAAQEAVFSTSEFGQEVELAGVTVTAIIDHQAARDPHLARAAGVVSDETVLFVRNSELPSLRVGQEITFRGRDYWVVAGLEDEGVITRIELARAEG